MPRYIHYTDMPAFISCSCSQRAALHAACNLFNDEENILHTPCIPARQVVITWLWDVFSEDSANRALAAANRFFDWGPSMSINPDDYEI